MSVTVLSFDVDGAVWSWIEAGDIDVTNEVRSDRESQLLGRV